VPVTATRLARRHAEMCGERSSGIVLMRHVARTTAWVPLLAGCITGCAVAAALLALARAGESPAALGVGIRVSFIPVIAGVAFLLRDPGRLLITTLPARAWLTPALRVGMAVPVLAASCAAQLRLAADALAADVRAPAALPWVALAGELAAWCAATLALAAALERTRWQDLAGLIAALGAMATVAASALRPLHLLTATITGMTSAQQRQWTTAWQFWALTLAIATAGACWAAGDPWWRLPRPAKRR
jgi:hypothetical protein